jgi:hypothetical protein
MYYTMWQPGPAGWIMPLVPFHFTLVQNIKHDPFEQAVGIDQKSAMSLGGALGAPMTAFQYDWNMLPIGQQLWEVHLVVLREVPSAAGTRDLQPQSAATLTGMSVDEFNGEVKKWIAAARDPRWKRPYTELTHLPMQEVLKYLRASGDKTYIVTGGGQDFVRVYAEEVYGIPPEQVVGTAAGTKYGYAKDGKPFLTKEPKLLLNDNNAGKSEGIHLMIGRRPNAAFGNSTGDRQMLEYTKVGDGARLSMLAQHDDAKRAYAYGPAEGLPATKVGAFTEALCDEARKKGWTIISMKNDGNRIFGFEP